METKQLASIPETMLITLWARATETMRPDALLKDDYTVEMIKKVDYDFSKFKKAKASQAGVCIRAKLIDEETLRFLAEHPDAVVIQLGAGIDARYQRLKCPDVTHWYDLDLEEVIGIRRELIPETDKNTCLALSLFDYRWLDEVKRHQKPIFIIAEGVLMYFEERQVRELLNEICMQLENATLVFDMLAFAAVRNAKHHDAVGKMANRAEFLWSELHTKDMEQWNSRIHLACEYYMSDHDQGRYPLLLRLLCKLPVGYRRFNQRVVRLEIHRH